MTVKASSSTPGSRSAYAKRVDDLSNLFEGLEGVEGERLPGLEATGAPLDVPLDDIEEDPDQPRRSFDEAALQDLAASIRERGVLQAVTVRPGGEGTSSKYRLVYGARRLRAARLAGLTTIRAVLREPSDADAYDQMVENIQRDDLSASEIAAFVVARVASGESQSDVARRLGKDRSYVAMHAAVAAMPEALRGKLDTGAPIRGVYELFHAWKKHPEPVLAFLGQRESFTRMEALTLVKSLKPCPKAVQAKDQAASEPHPQTALPASTVGRAEPPAAGSRGSGQLTQPASHANGKPRAAASPAAMRAPVVNAASIAVVVVHRRRHGRLVLDRVPDQGGRFVLVRFDDDEPVEVALAELRLVELVAAG